MIPLIAIQINCLKLSVTTKLASPYEKPYALAMTLELSQETQALLERALASGQFSSADHVIQYALGKAVVEEELPETEAFVARVKTALAASKKAVAEGRVVEVPKGTLADLMAERHKERLKNNQ